METENEYLIFKGLKKPLIFKGLKGKYIYQAGAAFGGTLVGGLIFTNLLGFLLGLLVTGGIGGAVIWNIFRQQRVNGLYKKTKNFDQLYIIPNRTKMKKLYEKN